MKTIIVYESKFGNGQKCVNELKKIIEEKGHNVTAIPIKDAKNNADWEADLYIFSSPVRAFMLPLAVKSFLKGFKPSKKGAGYGLMTTCLDPNARALYKMESILKKKDMVKKAEGLKIMVSDIKGPLEENYNKKIAEFADELLKNY